MRRPAAKLLFQSQGDPLADGTILSASLAPDAIDQALWQLDCENFFAFRYGQRSGLLLGSVDVASRLAKGNAKSSG